MPASPISTTSFASTQTDLLSNTNEVRYSLANRFFVKGNDGNVTEVMSWELSQARYFDPTFGGAVVTGQRNIVEAKRTLPAYAFLDGPRNYSPIFSIFRFQQTDRFRVANRLRSAAPRHFE